MSNAYQCCRSCYDMIEEHSAFASRLWVDLCFLNMQSKVFGIDTEYHESIRTLEILGFITTTETPDELVIKLNGFMREEYGSFFCGGNCAY